MRAWIRSLYDKLTEKTLKDKIVTGSFGILVLTLLAAGAYVYLFGLSTFYATLVDRDWHQWSNDAWIILFGTLIFAFAAQQDRVGKRWNGDLWWICALGYFFPPIICTGISNELTERGQNAFAGWLFTYRHCAGFTGVIAIFTVYYLSLFIDNAFVKHRKPNAGFLPRQSALPPTMPPRAASIFPFDRKKRR